jgi:hypothetical protein
VFLDRIWVAAEVTPSVREDDALDCNRRVAIPAVRDRRVGVGHLEGGHADGQSAEALGGIPVELGLDAHVIGGLAHGVRPDVEIELRVDRVVRLQRRLDQIHVPAVAVRVGLDLPRSIPCLEVEGV